MYRFARIISWILSPLIVLLVVIIKAIGLVPGTQLEKLYMLLIVILFGIVPSLLALLYLKINGHVSDWSISNRYERFTFIPLVILFGLITMLVLQITNLPHLFSLLFILLTGGLLFGVSTFITKVSAHAGAAMLGFMYLLHWYGARYMWVFILVVLVSWSRIYLRRHTLTQVLLGILLSFILFTVAKGFLMV